MVQGLFSKYRSRKKNRELKAELRRDWEKRNKDKRREYQRENIRDLKKLAREVGHCTNCLREKPQKEKDDGYSYCSRCREKMKEYKKRRENGKTS